MTKRIPTPMTRRLDPGPPAMSEADHAKALAEALRVMLSHAYPWYLDREEARQALDAYDKDHER